MIKTFFTKLLVIIAITLLIFQNNKAQDEKYIAIIPPFHCRTITDNAESSLKLDYQRFIVFVYSNAVAVYSESNFTNPTDDFLEQELALPSTGHDENSDEPGSRISSGILSIELWVEGERRNPQFIQDGNEEWYTIQTRFKPHETRTVKALFWGETSLANIDSLPGLDTNVIKSGKRGFLINLAHASVWKDQIESIDTYVILKDGISANQSSFEANPESYNLQDSILTWNMENIEPTENNNIEVYYESTINPNFQYNTMAKLSSFIIKNAYDELLDYSFQLGE